MRQANGGSNKLGFLRLRVPLVCRCLTATRIRSTRAMVCLQESLASTYRHVCRTARFGLELRLSTKPGDQAGRCGDALSPGIHA